MLASDKLGGEVCPGVVSAILLPPLDVGQVCGFPIRIVEGLTCPTEPLSTGPQHPGQLEEDCCSQGPQCRSAPVIFKFELSALRFQFVVASLLLPSAAWCIQKTDTPTWTDRTDHQQSQTMSPTAMIPRLKLNQERSCDDMKIETHNFDHAWNLQSDSGGLYRRSCKPSNLDQSSL